MHDRSRLILTNIGLSPLELEAAEMDLALDVPGRPTGYGLVGTTGIGKSSHFARRLARQVEGRVQSAHDPKVANMPFAFARWRNWPDTAENLKLWIGQGWNEDIANLVDQLVGCRELYLDDLGRERIVGPDDYALGVLRTLLDARIRAQRPVFWTSNQPIPELNKTYGTATVSRLVNAWPPVLCKGRDLRAVGRQV